MTPFEKRLRHIPLPQPTDAQHEYRLRRALLNSSYFESSVWGVISDGVKLCLGSKKIVAVSTASVVVMVITVMQLHLKQPAKAGGAALSVASSPVAESLLTPGPQSAVQAMTLEEINRKLIEAYQRNTGTLVLQTPEGEYAYSFEGGGNTLPSQNSFPSMNFKDTALTPFAAFTPMSAQPLSAQLIAR
jgi:hypothetical protein